MTTDTALYGSLHQKKAETPASGLLLFIQDEATDAAIYLQLSRILQATHKDMLRKMYRQEQSHAACLSGLYTLITGTHPHVQTPAIQMESLEQMLRRCYGREMRRLAQYEKKSADPEYGKIFTKLVVQEREHCQMLLSILSTLQVRH